VALVQWLAGVGRKPEAESMLAEAEQKLSGPGKWLAVAECRDALGQIKEAREAFATAVAQNPRDLSTLQTAAEFGLRTNNLEQVESLCEQILALQNLPPKDKAFATSVRALVLSMKDTPPGSNRGPGGDRNPRPTHHGGTIPARSFAGDRWELECRQGPDGEIATNRPE
jgi:tetratricopeptide (TPR) repeat protein